MPSLPPSAEETQQRREALEAELRETVARLNRVQEELNWKSAFLAAQVNSTLDGIIVVDPQGRKILQNQRAADLFKIPRYIVDDPDDTLQVKWIMDMTSHPDRFIEKVVYLYSHPDAVSHDEIELTNGTVLDRYSSPVTGQDGTCYGRIWTFHDITKRKQVEAALREHEEQLRAAIWASGTGTFRWDIRSNELIWDEALDALFGLPPGQTIRSLETFIAAVHPDDRAGVIELCERCAKEGADFDMEFRVLWPDGSQHWLDDKGKTNFDEASKPLYMTGACVDITARKESEIAMQKQQAELRVLFDLMPAMIWFKDTHNGFLKVNQRVAEATGLPITEIEGKTAEEIFPREAAGYYADDLEVIRSKAPKMGIIEKMQGPGNQELWVKTDKMPVCDKDGNVTGLIAMVHDITESKRAEDALRESESRYHSLFENMLEGYAHCRMVGEEDRVQDFIYLEVNSAFETLTGLKNVVGKTIGEVIPGAHAADPELFDMYQRVALTGEPERCETYLKSLGIWFSISVYSHQKWHFVAVFDNITERKRIEEELRQNQTELQVLFDLIPALVWFKDTQNHFLRANQRVVDSTGKPITEIEGKSAHEIYPQQAAAYYADDLEVIRSGAPKLGIVEKLRGPDDRELWVQTDKVPYHDKDGKVIGIVVMAQDITERKLAEAALRESEERFAGAFEHAPIGVALVAPDGRWLKVNRALCRLVGYTEAELLTSTFQDITHPDDLALDLEYVRQMLADEIRAYQMEKRYIHAAGQLITILLNVSLVRDDQEQPLYFIAQIQDITERKRTEESLRLLSSAVKQSKESIMITEAQLDLPGPKIIFVNPAFTEMTGYTAGEVLGLTPRLLQGPRTDRAVLERLRRNLEEGDAFAGETINYRKDGTEFDLEWQIAPLRNASSAITHFVAIQRDITERKRLEAQLVHSQKMETVGKLAGGVAHEFNSILTAIIGQSELLLHDLPGGSPLSGKVSAIHEAAGRAVILTRQLLAYGRKQTLQPELLNLNTILTVMAGTLHHLVGHNIDICSVPASGLRTVMADAGQISQVIVNMVINAHDAMPDGGKLTLETANITFDQDQVERYPELKAGDYVMLAISDTGTGMDAAVLARVFEPFFSTKGVGGGTGLGLSTCYGIIKQSGGHITVYSEPAVGTTFKIYLPQVAVTPTNPLQRVAAPGLPLGTETILLVEDDPALREMAGVLLQRLGYTVLSAASGIEALSLLNAHQPDHIDLLFTDFVMPQMNGNELAERVHALSPHTRTLFTTAHTANATLHQSVLNQDVQMLQKPFTPAALAQKLREVLDVPEAGI